MHCKHQWMLSSSPGFCGSVPAARRRACSAKSSASSPVDAVGDMVISSVKSPTQVTSSLSLRPLFDDWPSCNNNFSISCLFWKTFSTYSIYTTIYVCVLCTYHPCYYRSSPWISWQNFPAEMNYFEGHRLSDVKYFPRLDLQTIQNNVVWFVTGMYIVISLR